MGFSDVEILYKFPTMSPQDLKNAWNYYLKNKPEIEQDIHENTTDDDGSVES